MLAERVRRADWDQPLDGDCLQLAGSKSYFAAEQIDRPLRARCQSMDLHPTGPLWGSAGPTFSLPAGPHATAMLRELVDLSEVTRRT